MFTVFVNIQCNEINAYEPIKLVYKLKKIRTLEEEFVFRTYVKEDQSPATYNMNLDVHLTHKQL